MTASHKIRVRKHAPNFVGNTHTANITGEPIYGWGKTPEQARQKLIDNLKREGRWYLYSFQSH